MLIFAKAHGRLWLQNSDGLLVCCNIRLKFVHISLFAVTLSQINLFCPLVLRSGSANLTIKDCNIPLVGIQQSLLESRH